MTFNSVALNVLIIQTKIRKTLGKPKYTQFVDTKRVVRTLPNIYD